MKSLSWLKNAAELSLPYCMCHFSDARVQYREVRSWKLSGERRCTLMTFPLLQNSSVHSSRQLGLTIASSERFHTTRPSSSRAVSPSWVSCSVYMSVFPFGKECWDFINEKTISFLDKQWWLESTWCDTGRNVGFFSLGNYGASSDLAKKKFVLFK